MVLFVFALAMAAPQTAVAAPAPAPSAKPVKPKKICRDDRATGTRMVSSTCLTAAEWAARDAASRNDLDDTQRRSGSTRDSGL